MMMVRAEQWRCYRNRLNAGKRNDVPNESSGDLRILDALRPFVREMERQDEENACKGVAQTETQEEKPGQISGPLSGSGNLPR